MKKITIFYSPDIITLFFSMRPFVLLKDKDIVFKYIRKLKYLLNRDENEYLIIFVRAFREHKLDKIAQIELLKKLRNRYKRILLFEDKDGPRINYWYLLDDVDLYATPHMYKDIESRKRNQNLFIEYVTKKENTGSEVTYELISNNLDKIFLSWSLGVGCYPQKRVRIKVYARIIRLLGIKKYFYSICNNDIKYMKKINLIHSVFSQISMPNNYQRDLIIKIFFNDPRFLTKQSNPRRYFKDMLSCKYVLSPFGNGELCFRDFEAVVSKSLLLKPDMSHIETFPDIYKPYVTYVPLKWDLSDLDSQLNYYDKNTVKYNSIVNKAAKNLDSENQLLEQRVRLLISKLFN